MTFSLIGHCERTGMFGVAIATSEMAVGSRCIHVAPGVGAIITQASTNPRLGHLGLKLLRAGYSAPRVVEEIAASDQFVERRQLGALDVSGLAAARTGAEAGHVQTAELPALDVLIAGGDLREHARRRMAGAQETQSEMAEARVRAGLRDDRADAGRHVNAARADRHLAGGDGDAEHAGALAPADERKRGEFDPDHIDLLFEHVSRAGRIMAQEA